MFAIAAWKGSYEGSMRLFQDRECVDQYGAILRQRVRRQTAVVAECVCAEEQWSPAYEIHRATVSASGSAARLSYTPNGVQVHDQPIIKRNGTCWLWRWDGSIITTTLAYLAPVSACLLHRLGLRHMNDFGINCHALLHACTLHCHLHPHTSTQNLPIDITKGAWYVR
jgi:hypothetical protein